MSRSVRIGFDCKSCDNQSNFSIKIGGMSDIYHGIVVVCGNCGEVEFSQNQIMKTLNGVKNNNRQQCGDYNDE